MRNSDRAAYIAVGVDGAKTLIGPFLSHIEAEVFGNRHFRRLTWNVLVPCDPREFLK
jgi:hypothetical protein